MAAQHTDIAIIGGGPAGLMAAEVARQAGCQVQLFEAKGSVGRKFLIAGKGGLNLTHGEPRPQFDARYREQASTVGRWLDAFDAQHLRDWAHGLGVDTYVGSSGRVFPNDRKAAPLLRGWVRRLRESGVQFHVQHRWLGWCEDGRLRFATPTGEQHWQAKATVLALGGGSWPQLGSDGAWTTVLTDAGVQIAVLQPANCGFDIAWSTHLRERFAGAPLKPVIAHWQASDGTARSLQGECVISEYGIEGSLIYAASADLREAINRHGQAQLALDLAPQRTQAQLRQALASPRGKRSIGEHLRRRTGLGAAQVALLFEYLGSSGVTDAEATAAAIKHLPLTLTAARPMAEAISTAGGVCLNAITQDLMLKQRPGTFCAGEMLDWEAPTGGYLLQASFASGRMAGLAAVNWLRAEA